ncbi:universal stress protein [Microbacterium sp. SS28]|uniref:universal stress protein n=1 Tax=Microbacterium sp. SS28 TaxID=2919948 RepID=UPI001FA9C38D|nr:universal stress protein [Microbacterium sp. SS28]
MPEVIRDPGPQRKTAPLPWAKPGMLVGFDGSESSFRALQTALRMAPALEMPVHVAVIWDYPTMMYGDHFSPAIDPGPSEAAEELRARAVSDSFPDGAPGWFTSAAQQGRPSRTLVELSQQAEMVVVGSRGHGGFSGLLLGSVSGALASHSACSVLVVR